MEAALQGRFAFEPEADVLAFDRLLARIQLLPPPEIAAIAAELRALVRGTHIIHLLPHLQQQVEAQLAEERRIARYILDVFVETQETKYQARCFAHPALFVRRIAGWFERRPWPIPGRAAAGEARDRAIDETCTDETRGLGRAAVQEHPGG